MCEGQLGGGLVACLPGGHGGPGAGTSPSPTEVPSEERHPDATPHEDRAGRAGRQVAALSHRQAPCFTTRGT